MKKLSTNYYLPSAKISLWIFFGLLAYVPLHILLSTWLGSTLGVLSFAKIAKDIVLFVGFLAVLAASIAKPWFKSFLKDRLIICIGLYALLTVFMALIKPTDQEAELLAIVYNLRFLMFFIYGGLLLNFFSADWLIKRSVQVVLAVALPVLMFGLIQYMWLPDDALTKIGYARENGVLPAFHIDDKPDLERIMSTARDPNSYGSYLVILLSISLAYLVRVKNKDLKNVLLGMSLLTVLNLYFTFSRGAWIGAAFAVVAGVLLMAKRDKKLQISRNFIIVAILLITTLAGGLIVFKDTYFVRNVVFHSDSATVLEDPNQLRLRFWQESIESSVDNPLGHGPGTAGIVSIRNDEQGTVLNENYYLQILHEVGVFGLALFIAILALVFLRLNRNNSTLSLALVAALFGLLITNMLVHAWSVEIVAYTFWGLAGLIVFKTGEQT